MEQVIREEVCKMVEHWYPSATSPQQVNVFRADLCRCPTCGHSVDLFERC